MHTADLFSYTRRDNMYSCSKTEQPLPSMQGRTRPHRIKRYIDLSAGDVFDMQRVTADVQRLSTLGVFDNVTARPKVPTPPDAPHAGTNAGSRGADADAAAGGASTASGGVGAGGAEQGAAAEARAGHAASSGGAGYSADAGEKLTGVLDFRQGDNVDLDFQVVEKKKFGQFSCQGGATMVRITLCTTFAMLSVALQASTRLDLSHHQRDGPQCHASIDQRCTPRPRRQLWWQLRVHY